MMFLSASKSRSSVGAGLVVVLAMLSVVFSPAANSQTFNIRDKFRQLEEVLPTPNDQRAASGAPGYRYWQQQADYQMDIKLDDKNQRIIGSEKITYTNNSPDSLSYLWLQLDQNKFVSTSDANMTQGAPSFSGVSLSKLHQMLVVPEFDGSIKIKAVTDASGKPLRYTVVKTMLRVDLPQPLKPNGARITFNVKWAYNINDSKLMRSRSAFEHFEDDDNYLYEISRFYPRMAAYYDVYGWQHKQFLGSGEFTLDFGDYTVSITAPADHIVGSTGELQNAAAVLTEAQRERLEKSRNADAPIFIVTPDEAKEAQKEAATETKTWTFKAKNVRDFAFASSRKFIWDAMGVQAAGKTVLCMSYYPNEAEPLWSKYSTRSIAHTLDVYGQFTFEYPYPVAISVNGPIGGMEYPMICFNGPRPEKDGTYSSGTKYGLISVIIHEVGHNWFPMIVNSDERQWTWMDEGLNSFLQNIAESYWEEDYPSRRQHPGQLSGYMAGSSEMPIMTNSESILSFGNNAYGKPAVALSVLRETILGRELFDFSFKEYSNRWKFRRPTPSDFFRTMEDASGIDLDWFFRGWFYTADHVDLSIDRVRVHTVDTGNPDVEKPLRRERDDAKPTPIGELRNKDLDRLEDRVEGLGDFYNTYDPFDVTDSERESYQKFFKGLTDEEKDDIATRQRFYVVDLTNKGGLVSPVIMKLTFDDHSTETVHLPAEFWRSNTSKRSKMIMTPKTLVAIELDPNLETGDSDRFDNYFPRRIDETKFKPSKGGGGKGSNPMLAAQKAAAKKAAAKKAELKKEADSKEADSKEAGAKEGDADKKPADKPAAKKAAAKPAATKAEAVNAAPAKPATQKKAATRKKTTKKSAPQSNN